MHLSIRNIGIIKEADINIDGLTVIAGTNDTGKSTVGKLLFSIVKSTSRYKEDLEEDKEKNIRKYVEKIYFIIRRKINFNDDLKSRNFFYPSSFFEDIIKRDVLAVLERIEHIRPMDLGSVVAKELLSLKKLVAQDDDENKAMQRALKKIFYSEFMGDLINKRNINESSSFSIKETQNEILKMSLEEDGNIDFAIYDTLYFNDSTLIETPMVLNFSESIESSRSYFEIRNKEDRLSFLGLPNIPFHIKDIDSKLKESFYDFENSSWANELLNKTTSIINGQMKYISKDREFVYQSIDGKKFNSVNTASGIKTFGILQMLLKSGFLDDRSILVIDEPEVHLHPMWQVKYAEIIAYLVKNNINILLTTHSPYMLEALEVFSKKERINTNYYLATKHNDGTIINNVSDSIDDVYQTLSEPFSCLEKVSLSENFKW